MMMLTSLGTVPASFTLGVPFGVAEVMVAALAVSGLGIAVAALRSSLRARREHPTGRLVPVAQHALAA